MSDDHESGSASSRPSARAILTAAIGLLSVGLLFWVAPPGEVIDQISDMSSGWVLAAIGLELASCACYPILFRRFFPEPSPGTGRQVAWMSMGAGAVLPGGNFASAGATGLLLRRHGIGTRQLLERCGALLSLLTAFGFLLNATFAALLLIGVSGGPHDLEHTGGPILVSVIVLGSAALTIVVGRRYGARAPRLVRWIAAGLEGGWQALFRPHWRLLGAAGFLCFDMAALWAACQATGHPIGVPALAIAYFIGYLATMIPMPAGLGVLDSGLAGALVLYGFSPAASVGAVLVYHAIAIWVPGVGGLIAWAPTRFGRTARARRAPAVALPALAPLQLATVADEA
ncbi:MAG TPA: lysylphosphatidylglycerol synthase transmembrane domain-containing protein [Solirubrobacteraceae bacterium]|jgi:uncharacterized membrane protein YbhN (UPF0104 family)|nr:lysylphosphatidylglycerol synthase transmembrane domain-containing protein [Solirubrobacteraceae bacterium]